VALPRDVPAFCRFSHPRFFRARLPPRKYETENELTPKESWLKLQLVQAKKHPDRQRLQEITPKIKHAGHLSGTGPVDTKTHLDDLEDLPKRHDRVDKQGIGKNCSKCGF